jgi:hypothetical protein
MASKYLIAYQQLLDLMKEAVEMRMLSVAETMATYLMKAAGACLLLQGWHIRGPA